MVLFLDLEGNPVCLDLLMAQEMVMFVIQHVDLGDGGGLVQRPCCVVRAGGQLGLEEDYTFIGLKEISLFLGFFGEVWDDIFIPED